MRMLRLSLYAAFLALLDQLSKFIVVDKIGYGEVVPCVDGLFHLTYVQNFGAAFSMLQGFKWLFIVAFVAFVALVIWGVKRKILPFAPAELWFLATIMGGGLGNIIDRIFRGSVVDMIAVEFMDFPVFNVADCFITCGAVALIAHLVLFNRAFWRDDRKTNKTESREEAQERP